MPVTKTRACLREGARPRSVEGWVRAGPSQGGTFRFDQRKGSDGGKLVPEADKRTPRRRLARVPHHSRALMAQTVASGDLSAPSGTFRPLMSSTAHQGPPPGSSAAKHH